MGCGDPGMSWFADQLPIKDAHIPGYSRFIRDSVHDDMHYADALGHGKLTLPTCACDTYGAVAGELRRTFTDHHAYDSSNPPVVAGASRQTQPSRRDSDTARRHQRK